MRITENKLRRVIRRVIKEASAPLRVSDVIARYEQQREKYMAMGMGSRVGMMFASIRNQFEMWAAGDCLPTDSEAVGGIGPALGNQYAGWRTSDFQAVLDSGVLD